MNDNVLVVRASDYLREVGAAPFIGLPREEIERLHGAVEVLSVSRDQTAADAGFMPLVAFVVTHHNYTWLTQPGAPRSLGVRAQLATSSEPPLFLDPELKALAVDQVDQGCRLAGLVRGEELGLVYVVRRRERWPEAADRSRLLGNGDLRSERAAFDPWSQLLIDNLSAL
jgi:hypothetical protein